MEDYNGFKGYGVPVRLKTPDDFLKVRETLTRIGVASRKEKTLYQSCHILHKGGLYVVIHFKELFALDGKPSDFSEEDEGRRNTITSLLVEWGLVEVVTPDKIKQPLASLNKIKILPYSEKEEWSLQAKYQIGKKFHAEF